MAGFGRSTYNTKTGSSQTYTGNNANNGGQSLTQYGTPLSQYSQNMTGPTQVPNQNIYQGADANYIRNMATSYTPEQMAQMKTAATNVNAAGTRGMTNKLRELLAAKGMSGGGYEDSRIMSAMLGSNANLANTMSGIDISNAQTGLANQFSKAGMLNNLMGLGLQENQQAIGQDQFSKGLYSDMYKWGNQFDYQKQQDTQSNNQYEEQLALMKKMMGLDGGTGYTSNKYTVQRGRR
jgi:hypothetical protein